MNHHLFFSLISAHRAFFDDKNRVTKNDPTWNANTGPAQSILALCFAYNRLPEKKYHDSF